MNPVGVVFKWRKTSCRPTAGSWKPKLGLIIWFTLLLLLVWLLISSDFGMDVPIRIAEPTYLEAEPMNWSDPSQYVPLPPYNFTYIISNEELCGGQPLDLVIFAYTAPADVVQRRVIRDTWGNRELLELLDIRLIFPLGLANTQELNAQIELESRSHGDIVQAGFMDVYRNLSYKGVMMFQWMSQYCQNARFLVKVDIDVFVNTAAVVPFLRENYYNEQRFFGCKVYWRSTVLRPGDWCGKWCVEDREYRARVYPPYCWGSVYVVSADLIVLLAQAASRIPIWWIADVYLTGILPRALGKVKHVVLRDYLEEDTDSLLERLEHNPKATLFGFVRGTYDVHRSWATVNNHVQMRNTDVRLRYESLRAPRDLILKKISNSYVKSTLYTEINQNRSDPSKANVT